MFHRFFLLLLSGSDNPSLFLLEGECNWQWATLLFHLFPPWSRSIYTIFTLHLFLISWRHGIRRKMVEPFQLILFSWTLPQDSRFKWDPEWVFPNPMTLGTALLYSPNVNFGALFTYLPFFFHLKYLLKRSPSNERLCLQLLPPSLEPPHCWPVTILKERFRFPFPDQ